VVELTVWKNENTTGTSCMAASDPLKPEATNLRGCTVLIKWKKKIDRKKKFGK
jgi:hypothetical protein